MSNIKNVTLVIIIKTHGGIVDIRMSKIPHLVLAIKYFIKIYYSI